MNTFEKNRSEWLYTIDHLYHLLLGIVLDRTSSYNFGGCRFNEIVHWGFKDALSW